MDCDSNYYNYDSRSTASLLITNSTIQTVFEGLIRYLKRMGERGNSVNYQNFGIIGLHFSPDNKKKLFMTLDDLFLAKHNLEFTPPMGFLNKPFVPMLVTNLNISDLAAICGVDKAAVNGILQAISSRIGQVLAE